MSGLFYMAQDRLSDAEILFSHALHLPDFQRPEMKAYSLICLAMVLNKKRKNRCVLCVYLCIYVCVCAHVCACMHAYLSNNMLSPLATCSQFVNYVHTDTS